MRIEDTYVKTGVCLFLIVIAAISIFSPVLSLTKDVSDEEFDFILWAVEMTEEYSGNSSVSDIIRDRKLSPNEIHRVMDFVIKFSDDLLDLDVADPDDSRILNQIKLANTFYTLLLVLIVVSILFDTISLFIFQKYKGFITPSLILVYIVLAFLISSKSVIDDEKLLSITAWPFVALIVSSISVVFRTLWSNKLFIPSFLPSKYSGTYTYSDRADTWVCPKCRNNNSAYYDYCIYCSSPKSVGHEPRPSGGHDSHIASSSGFSRLRNSDTFCSCGAKIISGSQYCSSCGKMHNRHKSADHAAPMSFTPDEIVPELRIRMGANMGRSKDPIERCSEPSLDYIEREELEKTYTSAFKKPDPLCDESPSFIGLKVERTKSETEIEETVEDAYVGKHEAKP